jgi:putative membrane protein
LLRTILSVGFSVAEKGDHGSVSVLASVLVVVVALVHVYILVLEMFLWRTGRARAAFGTTAEFADATATMAANQGLYNGFLAAGLVWSLFAGAATFQFQVFFLLCVIVAGLYGATATRTALFAQTIPAGAALLAVLAAG